MTALLDTHFLLWIALGSRRLREYRWVERYAPWTVSPVSLLEIAFLGEVGRVEVRHAEFVERLGTDPRFVIDDVGSVALATAAFGLSWTRDPFDRLLVAHSAVRRLRLCTVDPVMLEHHSLVVRELAAR
ncbi:MAG: type II toxin-antitoxin system VapC family toxin [Deltaproteobacteria bacterium]|nr:type II toxin-antitoxin system VapC family toxin [Deltaproteobacteria bacterium]